MRGKIGQSSVRLLVAAVVVGLLALGAFVYLRVVRPLVEVTEAVEGPVVQAFYATGTLLPDREFPLNSNVEGIVTDVLVDKGDKVRKGQKVAFVKVDEYEFRFRQAEAELELKRKLADDGASPQLQEYDNRLKAAEQQLSIARRELNRLTDLETRSAASPVDVDRASDRVQEIVSIAASIQGQRATKKLELQKDVTVAEAALDIARWNVSQQDIRSPIDGVVLDRPVSIGTRVRVNDHLMQVADVLPGNLVMRAAVDEEDKVNVRENPAQEVRMTLYSFGNQVFKGQVKRVYPKADPERRTFEVDVRMVPPDERFSAGMTGELAFVVEQKSRAIVVPSQAVQNGNLWIVRDGRLHRADVRIGIKSVERTEVLAGLQPGDRVVLSAVGDLKAGQTVRTSYTDPKTAADLNKPKDQQQTFRGFNG